MFGRQINKVKEEIYSQQNEEQRLLLELKSLQDQNALRRKQLEELEEKRVMRTRPKRLED